ncbi:MAG: carbohydrate kinase family protein [Defluviitaleaceae bacterium]|nr:carbohydrate kinase family protein [Defluviitaleaceae bacterium]
MSVNIEKIMNYFETQKGKVALGIDGFVDEVWQIIKVRTSPTEYELYDKMQDFAKSVYDVGAGGYANEMVRKRRSHGGFTAHTGEAVDNLGIDTTLIGMFDKDGGGLDPVYKTFSDNCKVYSIGNTGLCPAYEFNDGKMMFPYVAGINTVDWSTLTGALSKEELSAAFCNATVVGIGYWSLLDNFDNLITKICENLLKPDTRIFFDFADIRKRDKQALMNTLKVLAKLSKKTPATLSLNEHEASILFSHYDKVFDWKNADNADKDIEYVRQQTGLDELVVHTPFFAVAATAFEGNVVVPQRYCTKPLVTTGAGDNFNGGYMAAIAEKGGLTLKERLMVGNCVSGHYLRNGASPTRAELKAEMSEHV